MPLPTPSPSPPLHCPPLLATIVLPFHCLLNAFIIVSPSSSSFCVLRRSLAHQKGKEGRSRIHFSAETRRRRRRREVCGSCGERGCQTQWVSGQKRSSRSSIPPICSSMTNEREERALPSLPHIIISMIFCFSSPESDCTDSCTLCVLLPGFLLPWNPRTADAGAWSRAVIFFFFCLLNCSFAGCRADHQQPS